MEPATSTQAISLLLQHALEPLTALGLGASRTIGILLILPVLTRSQIGTLLRAALALGLALPLVGHATEAIAPLGARPDRAVQIALIAAKEIGVGALIGFLLGIPFWTIQAVGELIDMQRGIASAVEPVDPMTQASAMNLLLGFVAVVAFIASDGLAVMAGTLYKSYAAWPLLRFFPAITLDSALAVVGLLDYVVRYAVLIAGPAVLLLLLVDLSVMLMGRFTPHLNAFDLAPTVKNVALIIFMLLYVGYLLGYIGAEVASTRGVSERLERLLQ
jgi:type III secretion protein T